MRQFLQSVLQAEDIGGDTYVLVGHAIAFGLILHMGNRNGSSRSVSLTRQRLFCDPMAGFR